MTGLREDSSLPVYRQLERHLRSQIERGNFGVGDRLPSEAELCREWETSRITVRQALAELQRDDLVERIPGKGTFVHHRQPPVRRLTALSGFGENMRAQGLEPGYETLDAEIEDVSEGVTSRLQYMGSQAFVIRRTLIAGRDPVGFHTSYLPPWLVEGMPPESLTKRALDTGSLYKTIEESGVELSRAEETVEPVQAGVEEAKPLDMSPGGLALRVRRTVFDINTRPVEYVILVYRPDRYSYRVELLR